VGYFFVLFLISQLQFSFHFPVMPPNLFVFPHCARAPPSFPLFKKTPVYVTPVTPFFSEAPPPYTFMTCLCVQPPLLLHFVPWTPSFEPPSQIPFFFRRVPHFLFGRFLLPLRLCCLCARFALFIFPRCSVSPGPPRFLPVLIS